MLNSIFLSVDSKKDMILTMMNDIMSGFEDFILALLDPVLFQHLIKVQESQTLTVMIGQGLCKYHPLLIHLIQLMFTT